MMFAKVTSDMQPENRKFKAKCLSRCVRLAMGRLKVLGESTNLYQTPHFMVLMAIAISSVAVDMIGGCLGAFQSVRGSLSSR